MSNQADTVIPSLPSTITGNGLFTVNQVVPNSSSSFDDASSNPSTSYSYPLMDPAKLIGTITAPFMNVGIPAYISTLYNNVFNINNNLQNNIISVAQDDRKYPTSFAVQSYVQTQISGVQTINLSAPVAGSVNGSVYSVVTSLNNTLITSVPNVAKGFQYVTAGNQPGLISLFWMDTLANTPRVGTTKTVMFADPTYLTVDGADNLVFLYAGDNSTFVHMGANYKYYQFVYVGDFVTFVQAYNGTNWVWLVTNCMGVFSNSVNVKNTNITPSVGVNMPLPGSSILPRPGFSSMGNLEIPAPAPV